MGQRRPSRAEIINKVSDAISAIEAGKKTIPVSKHFSSDQHDLGIEDTKKLWPLIISLLKEIKDIGPGESYAGSRPPQKSYEVKTEGLELWAYSWESESMDKKMYIKFCLKNGFYYYMGCHEDRP